MCDYCGRFAADLSQLNCWFDEYRSPLWDQDHSGNDRHLVPGSLVHCSGMFPERFRRVSVSVGSREIRLNYWDRAPKIRDSVLLNSWDSFLVTLPSISSEFCVMYSPVIPGTNMVCDWLFLGCSCVSLETAANFFVCFLTLPSLVEKFLIVVRSEFSVIFKTT